MSPADHCSGLVMSIRMAPVRTSLRTVLKCIALDDWASDGGAASLGIGGAGIAGGSGIWTYEGDLVDELEAPGVGSDGIGCLSLALSTNPDCPDRVEAPLPTFCSKNFSTCIAKLLSPASCLSIDFCFRSKKPSSLHCPPMALSHSSRNRSISCVNACSTEASVSAGTCDALASVAEVVL